jgi:hypothetical protein
MTILLITFPVLLHFKARDDRETALFCTLDDEPPDTISATVARLNGSVLGVFASSSVHVQISIPA